LLYISWKPEINITMKVINRQKLAAIAALLLIIERERKRTKLKKIWARHWPKHMCVFNKKHGYFSYFLTD